MADGERRQARRRARRRRAVVLGTAGAVAVAGAGTAWAMSGSDGPSYRLATASRTDIAQTVDADGVLAARDSSTVSFAADGTVESVPVAVGDKVHAGDTLATLDKSALQAAVTEAKATLAEARQRLADDEDAQAGDAPSSSDDSTSSSTPTATPSGARTPDSASVRPAQRAVEAAQRALDAAIATVTGDIDEVDATCTSADSDPVTKTVTADDSGTISDAIGSTPMVATLLYTSTTSTNPQPIASGGTYTFAGLTPGESYQLALIPRVDTAACSAALETLKNDQSSTTSAASVVSAKAALDAAMDALDAAVAALSSSTGPTTPTQPKTPTASGSSTPSQSSDPSSSADGNSSPSTTVTAEQIAADTKAIDAAKAQLAVAKHDVGYATLTSPISGTVGAVGIAKGDAVSASSSSSTITVVGSGTLSVDLSIGIADIDLVKVGQTAQVTVDGRSTPVAAKVAYVGATNSSDSTGSSSAYPVTVSLNAADARLFDGMGASVSIAVGEADNVLSVPISAVHTVGTLHTVTVYANGKASSARVTLGVEGSDRVQIESGLSAGDRVVLAEISASVPSSDTSRFGDRGGLSTINGGEGPVFRGPPPGGGR
jgi:trimeric autotransporter adhesin